MAKKANLSRLLRENHRRAEIPGRQPPSPAALYLMQLRAARRIPLPRRRLTVAADDPARDEIPRPVKIIHVD